MAKKRTAPRKPPTGWKASRVRLLTDPITGENTILPNGTVADKMVPWIGAYITGHKKVEHHTKSIPLDLSHMMVTPQPPETKTTPSQVGRWSAINEMLAPLSTHDGRGNITTLYGAMRSDGKKLKGDTSDERLFAASRTSKEYRWMTKHAEALNGVVIAQQLRTRVEVIDFDNCAKQTYGPVLAACMDNGVVPLLTVESGSVNSLHLYVVLAPEQSRADFIGWVEDAADHFMPNKIDPVSQRLVAAGQVEFKSTSSIRLPGSASLKRRAWAKPVPTFSPFAGKYPHPDGFVDQVTAVLNFCGLSTTVEGPRQMVDEANTLNLVPIQSTWDGIPEKWRYNLIDRSVRLGGSLQSGALGSGTTTDDQIAAMLDAAASERGGDRSQAMLDGFNILWSCGIRDSHSLYSAVVNRFADSPAFVKCAKKGHRWTSRRVDTFVAERMAWIANQVSESLSGLSHGTSEDTQPSAEGYKRHLANMRLWVQQAISEEWDWWTTWAMSRIFFLRFADSWDGTDVPLSNRDVQVFCGVGSSKAAAILKSLRAHGVLSDPMEGEGSSSALRWDILANDNPSSGAYSTVSLTPHLWLPSLTSTTDLGTFHAPLWHMWWHPLLVDLADSEVAASIYHPALGGSDSPLWVSLMSHMNTVRARVFRERGDYYPSGSTRDSRLSYLVNTLPVIPVGSPRLHLDEESFGFWSFLKDDDKREGEYTLVFRDQEKSDIAALRSRQVVLDRVLSSDSF